MTKQQTKTPYQRHQEAGHPSTRVSPNGYSIYEECELCQLSWWMPDKLNGNEYPITIRQYPLRGGTK